MTKVGELPVQRSDGEYVYIDVYEPGTFDHDPFLVQLSDGTYGTPYLKPLDEGDTGLLVQASDGSWWQVNSEGILVVEDWNDGRDLDTWAWTDSQFSGDAFPSGDALEGARSHGFNGFYRTAAMPDYPSPAPNLPVEVGDTLQFHFKIPYRSNMDTGQQYWFAFLVQEAPHHSTSSSVDWDRLYTVEAITGSNDLFRISRREGGTRYPYTGDGNATVDWRAGYWYRGVVSIWETGLGVDLYRHTGGGLDGSWSYEATVLGDAPKWNSGGIGIRSSGDGGRSHWDIIRKVP